jgi:hypothetical protein
MVQVFAIEKLHDQVRIAAWRGAEVGHVHDVGMAKPARDPGLATKAFERLQVVRKLARHHLDRDPLVQPQVRGPVDRAHQSFDTIRAVENCPDQRFGWLL